MNTSPLPNSLTYPKGFLDFLTLTPKRGHRIGDYEMQASGLERFNAALRALSPESPSLTLFEIQLPESRSETCSPSRKGFEKKPMNTRHTIILAALFAAAAPGMLMIAAFAAAGPAHAQGQFAGIQVDGIELVVDTRPPKPSGSTPVEMRTIELARQEGRSFIETTQPKPPPVNPRQVLLSDPTLLTNGRLCGVLERPDIRNALNEALKDTLKAQVSSKLPGGFGLHSQSNHQLGSTCQARAENVNNRVTVTMSVPGNRFFARITTPSGFPGEIDPNFHVYYDLNVSATILLPERTSGRLIQETASVTATNITEPKTRSVTGNLALAANGIVSFLGGPDFVSRLRQDRRAALGSLLSVNLGEINQKLGNLAQDMRLEQRYKGQVLVLTATSRQPAPGPIVK